MHRLSPRVYLWGGLFVLLLTALLTAVNVHWLAANTVTYGWDRLDHLITSFVYRDTLGEVTPRALLAALAYSDYYPPLVHWGAVLLYRVLGVSEDVAPLVNMVYQAVLLGSTFWIPAQWAGGNVPGTSPPHPLTHSPTHPLTPFLTGALAATLIALFPILFAMSRYLYLDFALTALVALSIALLLASERFGRRWPSLGFGLALGLAFLVKWTTAAFVVGPLVYVLWRSGALPYAWRHPRALLPHRGSLIACLLVGVGLFALWFALAPDVVGSLRLGWWLVPPLGLLAGGVIYSLLPPIVPGAGPTPSPDPHLVAGASHDGTNQPHARRTEYGAGEAVGGERGAAGHTVLRNILAAGVTAAFVIALWYLTNSEFLDYFLFTAYGREDEPFYAFAKYAGEVFNEHLSPWFALVFAVVALVWAWQAVAAGGWKPSASRGETGSNRLGEGRPPSHPLTLSPSHPLTDTTWVLLLWVIVPFFIFSFRVTLAHSRFLMPFLPPFAVWMAVGLMGWRPPWLRAAAIALVLLVGAAQFALISFDALAPWRAPLRVEIGGQPLNLLANGFFIQYPTSGVTDPGYAVAPDVLAFVDAQRQAGGMIAGREVAHLGLLVNSYQIHEKHFLYLIYKDFPQVRLRELARNWSEQPAYNQLFEMDFVLVSDTHTFRTNENSQAVIQRILHDPADAFNQAFLPVRQWTLPSGEQLTLYARRFASLEPGVAPADYQQLLTLFGDRLGAGDAVVLLSPDQVYMLGLSLPAAAGATIAPLPLPDEDLAATLARLQELAADHRRIFLVSHNAAQVDPNGEIEGWLRANMAAGNDLWAGGVRLTPFAASLPDAGTPLTATAWAEGPMLAAAGRQPSVTAGGGLVVWAEWEPSDTPLRASLQLLAPDGSLVAQEDRDITADRQEFVLLVPRSAAPGDYRLVMVVYDPQTGERLRTLDGTDTPQLGIVAVAPAPVVTPTDLPPLRHPEDAEDEGS